MKRKKESKESTSIKAFRAYLLGLKLDVQYIERHIVHVLIFLEWLNNIKVDIGKVTNEVANEYMLYIRESGRSISTQQTKITSVRKYYDFLTENRKVKSNPFLYKVIKGNHRKIPSNLLTEEQMQKIFREYQPSGTTATRNKAILSFVVFQGLNTGEIEELKLNDLNLKEGYVYIRGTRRRNERRLNLHSQQIILLQEYLSYRTTFLKFKKEKNIELVFLSTGNGEKIRNSISKILSKMKEQFSEFKDFQHIRQSVIQNWTKHNNLKETQTMAGHKYIGSTEIFDQKKFEELKLKLGKIHPLFN
jgi:site-specific recombinase XerD